ncbi:hypothetical protein A2823_02380 [Candidatus Nomurabacteria bacterium RIFCSPHIGHO2_01_FULL_41_91]|uniref:Uncharacterized protein n=1 Tax=Candidatus Nomurabacteria bacterium RIFCSPLOWO2_12_FULL_41_10 TaxID=1801795 RepID=A0A1F6YAL4_9BACT|nr:MAG: hypothetical protein A2823_02380 [Candidatus Nomurabacteria bacterium RIFCSPHIGHO2_01_FULL_41_91]OGI80752.1 MAG: hypothetical protein A3D43_00545 [Candidatus Nomurabacteria bacterium RIFCSPHIGHO2_02_FULL_41_52]OGI84737.1 MAG: hypothetical protein A3F49_02700 [Candidatus Nomurabacteria bacterium RIFCSPHIGHO2_12_FULL_42_19]OGI93548.1 MAG: hypothetical protein A3A07_00940 [Candidatus Nomurabacteria bacterium RIFCSPLOWO2_01_FULL_41_52]OGI99712.1 MAG: hypothetical protein A3H56_01130 [Candid
MQHKGVHRILSSVADESGIWRGERKRTHGFLLSPSVYRITSDACQELVRLGHALTDCMLGLSHIAVIAHDQTLNYRGAWMLARQVFSTGIPKVYQELQGMNVKHIPKLLKVDLMVDQEGRFRIAEIDGHNKHGVGYSALCVRFREALRPNVNALPGLVKTLAEEIKGRGRDEVKVFYADQERFYVPEFEVAAQEFAKHGVECQVVSEMDADEAFLEKGLFLDLPFLYKRKGLYSTIIPAYKSGAVEFIIPPKPFLGAKGVLALLRNDDGNGQLESLLQSFIKKESLEFVRGYIPETLLVGKHAARTDAVRRRVSSKRYVLKESISSGMKGVFFSDEEDFDAALRRADLSSMNWVLQERVENQPQTFSWIESGNGNEPELKTADDWYMRVIAQYVGRKLADVIITSRRDHAVHGGKDCIQLGTIIAN